MSSRKVPKRRERRGVGEFKGEGLNKSTAQEETRNEAQMMINAAPLLLKFYPLFRCDQLISLELPPTYLLIRNC